MTLAYKVVNDVPHTLLLLDQARGAATSGLLLLLPTWPHSLSCTFFRLWFTSLLLGLLSIYLKLHPLALALDSCLLLFFFSFRTFMTICYALCSTYPLIYLLVHLFFVFLQWSCLLYWVLLSELRRVQRTISGMNESVNSNIKFISWGISNKCKVKIWWIPYAHHPCSIMSIILPFLHHPVDPFLTQ